MLQPKLGKMLVFDSADFEKKIYAEFLSILKILAKLLSSTFIFFIYCIDRHTKSSIYK